MNRKIGNGFQFVLGFVIVTLLWVIGWLACDPFEWLLNVEHDGIYQIFDIVLYFTPFLISLYLILLSVLGKRNNYKVLYFSALSAVCLPIIAYIFGELSLNDSSILTWILGLTVGWILYPFGVVAINIFDNIGFRYCEGIYIVAIMVLFVIISLIIFKKGKRLN